jgi:hypothetical protein
MERTRLCKCHCEELPTASLETIVGGNPVTLRNRLAGERTKIPMK